MGTIDMWENPDAYEASWDYAESWFRHGKSYLDRWEEEDAALRESQLAGPDDDLDLELERDEEDDLFDDPF